MRQMMHRCRPLPMQITSPATLARLLLRSQAVCKEESNHG